MPRNPLGELHELVLDQLHDNVPWPVVMQGLLQETTRLALTNHAHVEGQPIEVDQVEVIALVAQNAVVISEREMKIDRNQRPEQIANAISLILARLDVKPPDAIWLLARIYQTLLHHWLNVKQFHAADDARRH